MIHTAAVLSFDLWLYASSSTILGRCAVSVLLYWLMIHAEIVFGANEGDSEFFDAGFLLTAGVYEYLKRNLWIAYILTFINTAYCLAMGLYFLIYRAVYLGDMPCAAAFIAACFCRVMCGMLTVLPISPRAIVLQCEYPAMFSAGNGIMFYSGHTCNCELGRLILRCEGKTKMASLVFLMNSLQTIRLLAMRGHYTIDIIAGYFSAHVLFGIHTWTCARVQRLDKWLARNKTAISLQTFVEFEFTGPGGTTFEKSK